MNIQNKFDQLNILYVKFDKNLKVVDASKPYLDFVKCDSLSDLLGKEYPDLFKKNIAFFVRMLIFIILRVMKELL